MSKRVLNYRPKRGLKNPRGLFRGSMIRITGLNPIFDVNGLIVSVELDSQEVVMYEISGGEQVLFNFLKENDSNGFTFAIGLLEESS